MLNDEKKFIESEDNVVFWY